MTDPTASTTPNAAQATASTTPGQRSVLLVAHTGRGAAVRSAQLVIERLHAAGMVVRVLDNEAKELGCPEVRAVPPTPEAARDAEAVIVLGGDGTLLRAAELARPVGTPLLGVNLGHVGFLAEAEREDLTATVDKVVTRGYSVEERMTLEITVRVDGTVTGATWALNEASVEKASRRRMLEVVAEIDGRPLSRWGCDGVVCATPTGSTAYAFSAGGPVVWPEVAALLVVPISAHALFGRPLVVSPDSAVAVELVGPVPDEEPGEGSEGAPAPIGVVWCDGRRSVDLPYGARVEVRRGAHPVRLARLHHAPFTDRLVAKFGLPVTGWRGRRSYDDGHGTEVS